VPREAEAEKKTEAGNRRNRRERRGERDVQESPKVVLPLPALSTSHLKLREGFKRGGKKDTERGVENAELIRGQGVDETSFYSGVLDGEFERPARGKRMVCWRGRKVNITILCSVWIVNCRKGVRDERIRGGKAKSREKKKGDYQDVRILMGTKQHRGTGGEG